MSDQAAPSLASFDAARAARYDRDVRRGIPGYDGLHRLTAALLCNRLHDDAHILVVGAGTGEELIRLSAANAGWRFTAVDPSAEMAERLQERVANQGIGDRVRLHVGPLRSLPPDGPPFDAATLLLVLHFVPDDGANAQLLAEIAGRLAPDAPLLLADLVGAPGTHRFAVLLRAWATSLVLDGLSRGEVEAGFATILDDVTFVPTSRLRALWTDAGFARPVHFYATHLVRAWILTRRG